MSKTKRIIKTFIEALVFIIIVAMFLTIVVSASFTYIYYRDNHDTTYIKTQYTNLIDEIYTKNDCNITDREPHTTKVKCF